MKYAFIQKYENEYRVSSLCRVMQVSRSGYYTWRDRPAKSDAPQNELLSQIRRVHMQSRQAYGAKKTWLALKSRGVTCGKHSVARLRKQAGIEARRKRRFRITVENHATAPAAPNLVQQQFRVDHPNRIWVGDMTYIRTRQGWLYLAILLDLYSRRVVGWSMSDRPDLALILNALDMALEQRQPRAGLIHHTDQGPIYAARKYRERMAAHGIQPSMSAKGNAYDNAVAESFFGNLKNEVIHHIDFESRDTARAAVFDYIELFYNRSRMHQSLGYVSPVEFERSMCVA
ncbi:IS3 family transposase [Sideroxydans lithotrophicus]|uniref:Integrase catalytic region n=1 Tax=Sideroxydans lithotrophicus (strain ES-1) TaxID=580332 RepID=D5CLX0_SIDLE|nr:IS3 family transposase [Sideroxydans lithotrophicus]ADE12565.1 Integrase catalytic region [Sideroxydans lithotrophicus ES-1]ADE13013.1 Integrase catalytic region [Sideroxydans lithotrophicus ES-1]